MEFSKFGIAIAKQFQKMHSEGKLFRTSVSNDDMWAKYLSSFPAGSDPIFRVRSHHDCNCCKQFIRKVGNVVAIIDNKLVSIWDVVAEDPNYQAVADGMSVLVKSAKIVSKFLHYETSAGNKQTFEDTVDSVKKWEHFYVNIPSEYTKPKDKIPTLLGESTTLFNVLTKSLSNRNIGDVISNEAIDTVLDLIAQNSLYRGVEHKSLVVSFKEVKNQYDAYKGNKELFVWQAIDQTSVATLKIKNSVIGTLLTDLSDGMSIDSAVGAFETKVAPTNYKRPTAVVTKPMIEAAKKTIEELGLTSALNRRYASLDDIPVIEALFVSRSTRSRIGGDIFSTLADDVPDKKTDKVVDMSISDFVKNVLPTATSLEVLVENRHINNFVTVTTAVDPTANNMFKWNNMFGWSYQGAVTDSIKEKVKTAGGNITGDLCCRLAWFNYDDLDFYMIEPNGYEIYFSNRGRTSPSGGNLDVDMNAGGGKTRTPVENIFYHSTRTMKEGVYTLFVHNFCRREMNDVGFVVEFDFMGDVKTFTYDKAVNDKSKIDVIKFRYNKANGIEIIESLPSSTASKEVWGVKTSKFVPVKLLMNSPNHWDGNSYGNRHFFFMLEGCQNSETVRGIYNEFLRSDLNQHRKVIEIVGAKMQTENSVDQLSGIGFSDTLRNSVLCRVGGNFSRVINVLF